MIDSTDKKIFNYLMQDCRITTTKLAKLLHIPQSTVSYKIKKLEAEHINKYDIIPNFNILPIINVIHFVKVPKKEMADFVTQLSKERETYTVFELLDYFTIFIVEIIPDHEKSNLASFFKDYEHRTYYTKKFTYLPFTLFEEKSKFISQPYIEKPIVLEEIDCQLIDYLCHGGGRDPLLTIATKLHTTFNVISYRFKKLKTHGYFPLHLAQPTTKYFGTQADIIQISTKGITLEEIKRKGLSLNLTYILELEKDTFMTQLFTNSHEEYKSKLSAFLDMFSNNITSFKTYAVRKSPILNKLELAKILYHR